MDEFRELIDQIEAEVTDGENTDHQITVVDRPRSEPPLGAHKRPRPHRNIGFTMNLQCVFQRILKTL